MSDALLFAVVVSRLLSWQNENDTPERHVRISGDQVPISMAKPKTVTREKLCEEVRQTPGSQLAKRYGISDVALVKICRKMDAARNILRGSPFLPTRSDLQAVA